MADIEQYLNKIICGDAIEVMAEMPDESIDLVFADPPFNVGKSYPGGDNMEHYQEWCAAWIGECFRVLKPTGSFYLMTIPKHLGHTMRSMNKHGNFIDQIIWRTTSLNASPKQHVRLYQLILFYAKTGGYTFHPKAQQIKRNYTVRASQLKKKPELAIGYPGRVGNLWDDIKFIAGGCMAPKEAVLCTDSKKKAHPCQMPVALAERAIVFSSNERDIVLDPFIGSGTTAVACIKTGRRYVGIDSGAGYCKLSEKRIADELAQPELIAAGD